MPAGSPAAQSVTRPSANAWRATPLFRALKVDQAHLAFASMLAFALYPQPALAAPALGTISPFSGREEWLRPILCGLASMVAFLALRAVIGLIKTASPRSSDRKAEGDVSATSVEHFISDSQKLHIDPHIARETFELLAALLPVATSVGIHDELRRSLQLSDSEIDSLLSTLPELCDRSRIPANSASVLSVYDLLCHIESSPKSNSESKSGLLHSRTGSTATSPATLPTSPLADLQNASPRDSRFRTRAHFSGVKRRASDYSGPYRRATDRRPDENYSGPLRRASDRQNAAGTGSDPRSGDRRSSERRAVVAQEESEPARQHRAVSADTSLLNQCLNLPSGQIGSELVQAPMTRESAVAPPITLQRS